MKITFFINPYMFPVNKLYKYLYNLLITLTTLFPSPFRILKIYFNYNILDLNFIEPTKDECKKCYISLSEYFNSHFNCIEIENLCLRARLGLKRYFQFQNQKA